MPRLAYAAQQLIDQVAQHRPDGEVTRGEPDGIGVVRSITFDRATSKWLWPLLRDSADQRIASTGYTRSSLTVVFQARSTLADDRSPFDLPVARRALPAKAAGESGESGERASDGHGSAEGVPQG